ncbi:MAG: hypothetical protein Q8N99_00570 [Nanoarchaeota archaeon]|nr:hypothetical protein [Nanoarchaeota archaeon]
MKNQGIKYKHIKNHNIKNQGIKIILIIALMILVLFFIGVLSYIQYFGVYGKSFSEATGNIIRVK